MAVIKPIESHRRCGEGRTHQRKLSA
jgi:hypothetical protein